MWQEPTEGQGGQRKYGSRGARNPVPWPRVLASWVCSEGASSEEVRERSSWEDLFSEGERIRSRERGQA